MDLQQEWAKLNAERFNGAPPPNTVALRAQLLRKGHSPLLTLRRNLRINLGFTVVFLLLFVWLYLVLPHLYIRICIGILIISYVAAIWYTSRQLRRLPTTVPMDGDLLSTLRHYHHTVDTWLRTQARVALFIYPFSITGGFLAGLSSEANLDEELNNPWIIVALVVCVLILTPLSHLLTRWMSKVGFGKYLDQLQEHIDVLEKPE